MVNRAKEKGDRFELLVRDYFRDSYWPTCARRGSQWGSDRYVPDKGDLIDGPEGFVIECKDHQSIDLAGYMDQAAEEARNARTGFFAAIVKRRRRPVADAYVVMPLRVFVELAHAAEMSYLAAEDV
jgi:hypothetical protein